MLTCKDRLHKVLHKETVDRPPCICPGGMMNMITTDLMEKAKIFWPDAHFNAQMMADLALASYDNNCFENVGVPFCMTVEAESLGSSVTIGTEEYEPHVNQYAANTVLDWDNVRHVEFCADKGRVKIVLDAIKILHGKNLSVPIIGNITGPISTASSVMEPGQFYKDLRKHPTEAHEFLAFITEHIAKFAKAQIAAGADIIAISDPSGTGEILGPKMFEEYAVKYLNILLDEIEKFRVDTIVHICGQMNNVYEQINKVHSNALSFDSCVPMLQARANLKDRVLMGNVSTYALEFGQKDKVKSLTENCIKMGSDILSPACGLGTGSPLSNIQAMLETVIER